MVLSYVFQATVFCFLIINPHNNKFSASHLTTFKLFRFFTSVIFGSRGWLFEGRFFSRWRSRKDFQMYTKFPTLVYLQNVCEYAKVRSVANTTCLSVFFVISSFQQTFRPQQSQISPNLLWEQTTSSCPWFDLHRKLCGQTSTWSWNNVWVCVLNFTEQIHNVLTKTPAKHNLFKKILQHLVINISQPTLLSGKVYLFSLFIKRGSIASMKSIFTQHLP